MSIEELKKDIKNNCLKKIYIMTGEETGIRDLYISKIVETTKQEVIKVDSIQEIYTRLNTKSLTNNNPCIYLVQEDIEFFKLNEEKVWGQLRGKDVTIIFTYNNIDKRSKYYKYYSKEIVVFEKLAPQVLVSQIIKEINLEPRKAEQLALSTQYYSLALIEIHKINQVATMLNINVNQAYTTLEREGQLSSTSKSNIFDLINAIMDRTTLIFKLQAELKEELKEPFGLLSMLGSNFLNMLLIKSVPNGSKLDINPYIINILRPHINKYTEAEIRRNIKTIKNIEVKIKQGKLDIIHAIDYLLFELIKKEV